VCQNAKIIHSLEEKEEMSIDTAMMKEVLGTAVTVRFSFSFFFRNLTDLESAGGPKRS
jgi:hypothetical protein